jgi:arylesterase/paraoxonase
VEVFDVDGTRLRHRASRSDPEHLVMPNDVAAVDDTRFYVTNTHAQPPGPAQTLETFLRRPGARLVLWDGERFETALGGLTFPNGVALRDDGRRLYLAFTTPRSVGIYDRDPASGALAPRRRIFVGSGLDNVEIGPEGDLWIGSHPKLLTLRAHGDDPAKTAPSQVLRVDPESGDVEEVYLDDGSEIAGASVAAVRGDRMVVGQIFGEGILDCTLPR